MLPIKFGLLLLCCSLLFETTESFTAQHWFSWGILWLWNTRSHDRLSRSAVCIAQHKWLADQKGLNAPEPNADGGADDDCPFKAWDNELKTSFRKSAKSAAETIVKNAYQPDMQSSMSNNPSYHFDSDPFLYFANVRLKDQRRFIVEAIRKLRPGDAVDEIHREIGYFMHTLQDFYSHSNWVEIGMTSPNEDIGIRDLSMPIASSRDIMTCSNCTRNFTLEQAVSLTAFLDTFAYVIEYARGWRVENVYVCYSNILNTGYLTSGYYGTEAGAPKPRPGMKCSHGGGHDSSSRISATGGINKDSNTFLYSPHFYLHYQAATLAVQASVQFLQGVRREVADDAKFGRILGFNTPKTIGILMDTTGSMSGSINAAKAWASSIVQEAASGASADALYYLTPFNDPQYGPVMVFSDPKLILAELNKLNAAGGGDTPEMCFPALYETVQACPEQTKLYVFTDAPSKHGELASGIRAGASKKSISISFLMSGGVLKDNNGIESFPNNYNNESKITKNTIKDAECNTDCDSDCDHLVCPDVYRSIAFSSGGLFMSAGASQDQIIATTKVMSETDWQYLLSVDSLLTNTGRGWLVPVDDTITEVELLFSSIGSSLHVSFSLTDSANRPLANTTIISTYTTLLISFNVTGADVWRFNISSTNGQPLSFLIRAQSDLSYGFTLLDQYMMPIITQPLSDAKYFVVIECSDCGNLTTFDLVNCTDGLSLSQHEFQQSPGAPQWLTPNVSIPLGIQEVCYYFQGKTPSGTQLGRFSDRRISPSTINLSASAANNSYSYYPNQTATIYFNVTNIGQNDSFSFTVADTLGFVQTYSPNVSAIIASQSTLIGDITLFTNGSIGQTSDIQISVMSTESALTANILTITVLIIDPNTEIPSQEPPSSPIIPTTTTPTTTTPTTPTTTTGTTTTQPTSSVNVPLTPSDKVDLTWLWIVLSVLLLFVVLMVMVVISFTILRWGKGHRHHRHHWPHQSRRAYP